ncbi:MAG: hypothetical protein SOT81_10765 [Treponema sp.]|nr:hypothetical protein [Treponema sp.]
MRKKNYLHVIFRPTRTCDILSLTSFLAKTRGDEIALRRHPCRLVSGKARALKKVLRPIVAAAKPLRSNGARAEPRIAGLVFEDFGAFIKSLAAREKVRVLKKAPESKRVRPCRLEFWSVKRCYFP